MDEAAFLMANALVSSHLDYYNSLFRSLSSFSVYKLQCILNTVANCNRYSWTSPILRELHWWSVRFHRIFKTATLAFKFLHSGHPSCFGCLLSTCCGSYGTRYNHSDKRLLEVPQFYSSLRKSKKNT